MDPSQLEDYERELLEMESISREEYLATLRRLGKIDHSAPAQAINQTLRTHLHVKDDFIE